MVEFAIADLEFELIGKHAVLEDLSNVVDIVFSLVGQDERVFHDIQEALFVVVLDEVVVSVCSINLAVLRVVQHRCIQGVEGDEVGDLSVLVLDDPRVHHTFAGQQKVMHFFLIEHNVHLVVLLEVTVQCHSHCGDIRLGHLSETLGNSLLGQIVLPVEFGLSHLRGTG